MSGTKPEANGWSSNKGGWVPEKIPVTVSVVG